MPCFLLSSCRRDPLNLFIDGDTQEAAFQTKESIAWFRHAEIKHGRVAMAAFVGYCVQSQGIVFPGMLSMPLKPSAAFENTPPVSFADIAAAGSPADQWDALPSSAKIQILLFVGFLELFGESTRAFERDGTQHYVRGGKPGYCKRLGPAGVQPWTSRLTCLLIDTSSPSLDRPEALGCGTRAVQPLRPVWALRQGLA